MARPTRKIKCRKCKRKVDAIIAKDYWIMNKKDPDEDLHYQQLIVKDHRKSIWKSKHCSNSGSKFRMVVGTANVQAGP